jgi:hypothetical protein
MFIRLPSILWLPLRHIRLTPNYPKGRVVEAPALHQSLSLGTYTIRLASVSATPASSVASFVLAATTAPTITATRLAITTATLTTGVAPSMSAAASTSFRAYGIGIGIRCPEEP